MGIERNYTAVTNAVDAKAALAHVFLAIGDSAFTADKRVAECFFLRGRNRTLNTDLFSYASSSDDISEDESSGVEEKVVGEYIKVFEKLLVSIIDSIEEEYKSAKRVTRNITGQVLDLKTIYSLVLSRSDLSIMSRMAVPNYAANGTLWNTIYPLDYLETTKLKHFTVDSTTMIDRDDPIFILQLKLRVERDRYHILDTLVDYFIKEDRLDIVEDIKVAEFDVVSKPASEISSKYKLTDEQFEMVNQARLNYISRVKIDLKYAQELTGLAASTFKKRVGPVKERLITIGQDIQSSTTNSIEEFLIN